AMDDDQNGIDNAQQPSNCLNPLTTNSISDGDKYLVKDFSSLTTSQTGVFVNLNINSSCNNTNAAVYLSVNFETNTMHAINYRHFGATTSSAVLNNDTANVYSESIANGKLKFILIDKKLYIQRVSTSCNGSNYQIVNSCYSLVSQQILAMEDFIANSPATIVAFPNPTTNSFTIDTKSNGSEFGLSIYNIDGKFITSKFEKTDDNLLQVNMEQYAEGIYFVVLFDKTNSKYNYLKIIKK
uniref:T9SS type A sorting domain-containing protein n=1 Tax=Flavobacterium sp. TaxID=239 RepID=UPI0037525C13